MKKLELFVIILVVLVLFAYADFALNVPDGLNLPTKDATAETKTDSVKQTPVVNHPNVTKLIVEASPLVDSYKIEKRTRTTALFESFDLKDVSNTVVYSNILSNTGENPFPIYIYEIHGPKGQGSITYLNIKLKIIDQLGSSAGINETGSLGYNSLFYNDEGNPNTGFLLTQIGDMVFGFKYSKNNSEAFDSVDKFIKTYMSLVTQN